jgi:hypothetical protein
MHSLQFIFFASLIAENCCLLVSFVENFTVQFVGFSRYDGFSSLFTGFIFSRTWASRSMYYRSAECLSSERRILNDLREPLDLTVIWLMTC